MHRALATLLAVAFVPAIAAAQEPQPPRDTIRVQQQDTLDVQEFRGQVETDVRGPADLDEPNLGLTREQVQEVQQALHEMECQPGPVDGIVGPRTRSALTCAREQLGIQAIDPNVLLLAMNLDFMEEYRDEPRDPQPEPMPAPAPEPTPEPLPEPTPEPLPEPTPEPLPEPTPEPLPEPTPEPLPEPTPEPLPEPTPEPLPEPTPEPLPPEPTPEPEPLPPTPEPTPRPVPPSGVRG